MHDQSDARLEKKESKSRSQLAGCGVAVLGLCVVVMAVVARAFLAIFDFEMGMRLRLLDIVGFFLFYVCLPAFTVVTCLVAAGVASRQSKVFSRIVSGALVGGAMEGLAVLAVVGVIPSLLELLYPKGTIVFGLWEVAVICRRQFFAIGIGFAAGCMLGAITQMHHSVIHVHTLDQSAA